MLAALSMLLFVAVETAGEARIHQAAMAAHHLCSGVFVVGRELKRSPEQVLKNDIRRFDVFQWQDDFRWEVDDEARTARVFTNDGVDWTAKYNGDQGCTILPPGRDDLFFGPEPVVPDLPDPSSQPWPLGDVGARAPPPSNVDPAALDAALDWAMAQDGQNTRALVVTYQGKILGERYQSGFTRNTPQISWSMGKSLTSALIGILVGRGHLKPEQPAPVAAWQEEGDPRSAIRILDLLQMSSGLDFKNYGLDEPNSWTKENEHFRIYFDAIDVFEHAVNQPLELAPGSRFRYRNSDPLTLGRIVREYAEAEGESYLTFPQRALFDRIGARNYVLECDPYGNFIMTGYDFGSAWDWTRFGLLHLWDGVFEGERVLPEGWVELVTTPAPGDPDQGYGGLFWLNRGGAMPHAPEDAFWAAGFMGQRTLVIPSRDLVVVRLGPSPAGFAAYFDELVGRILESIP